ncbi:methyl-accepting chemotaxis protein, partial [Shewanella sp. 11B5]
MLIRSKLILSSLISISSVLAMFGLQNYSESVLLELSTASNSIVEIEKKVLELRTEEKDFLHRADTVYIEKFKHSMDDIVVYMAEVRVALEHQGMNVDALDHFKKNLNDYKTIFNEIIALKVEIGLTPESGLYGDLRSAVKKVEIVLSDNAEDALLVAMLQLRRSEKDFMLRRDPKYIQAFDDGIARFLTQIQQSNIMFSQKELLTADVKDYQVNFKKLVDKEVLFGLTDEDGKMAELREKIHQTDNDTVTLREETLAEIEHGKKQAFIIGLSIFL